jgi:hypothetical protein
MWPLWPLAHIQGPAFGRRHPPRVTADQSGNYGCGINKLD